MIYMSGVPFLALLGPRGTKKREGLMLGLVPKELREKIGGHRAPHRFNTDLWGP